MLFASRLVVGSSKANIPHCYEYSSARANLITIEANIFWPADDLLLKSIYLPSLSRANILYSTSVLLFFFGYDLIFIVWISVELYVSLHIFYITLFIVLICSLFTLMQAYSKFLFKYIRSLTICWFISFLTLCFIVLKTILLPSSCLLA